MTVTITDELSAEDANREYLTGLEGVRVGEIYAATDGVARIYEGLRSELGPNEVMSLGESAVVAGSLEEAVVAGSSEPTNNEVDQLPVGTAESDALTMQQKMMESSRRDAAEASVKAAEMIIGDEDIK